MLKTANAVRVKVHACLFRSTVLMVDRSRSYQILKWSTKIIRRSRVSLHQRWLRRQKWVSNMCGLKVLMNRLLQPHQYLNRNPIHLWEILIHMPLRIDMPRRAESSTLAKRWGWRARQACRLSSADSRDHRGAQGLTEPARNAKTVASSESSWWRLSKAISTQRKWTLWGALEECDEGRWWDRTLRMRYWTDRFL
jgi:hypothetical protein